MNLKSKFHLGKLCFLFLLQEENPSQRTVKDSFFIDSNKDKIKIQTHYKSSAGKINIRIYFKLFYVVYQRVFHIINIIHTNYRKVFWKALSTL